MQTFKICGPPFLFTGSIGWDFLVMTALSAVPDQSDRVIDNFKTVVGHSGRMQNTEPPVLKITNHAAAQADQMGMQSDIGIEMSLGCTTVYLAYQTELYEGFKNPVHSSAGHTRHLATEVIVQLVSCGVISTDSQCPHNRLTLRRQTDTPGSAHFFELLLFLLV